MARRIQLATHLSANDLEQRYRAAQEPHERTWWQILWLLAKGQAARVVAKNTGYSRYWIGQIAKRSNAEGPAGMINRQRTTSWRAPRMLPRMLSAEQQEELRRALAGDAPEGAKRWSARAVADWMAEQLGRPVQVQRGWDSLQRLKHSQQLPRPRHALADAERQAACKKRSARSSSR